MKDEVLKAIANVFTEDMFDVYPADGEVDTSRTYVEFETENFSVNLDIRIHVKAGIATRELKWVDVNEFDVFDHEGNLVDLSISEKEVADSIQVYK